MNIKRLLLAIAAGFVFIFVSDILIHGIWMMPDYRATAQMWRTDPEMQARIPWMWLAQLLCATTFTMIWAKGFADRSGLKCACIYGAMMGAFAQVNTLIQYVVAPLPPSIALKWFFVGIAQAVALGVVVYFTYGPAPAERRNC